jgi:hypothetical protein
MSDLCAATCRTAQRKSSPASTLLSALKRLAAATSEAERDAASSTMDALALAQADTAQTDNGSVGVAATAAAAAARDSEATSKSALLSGGNDDSRSSDYVRCALAAGAHGTRAWFAALKDDGCRAALSQLLATCGERDVLLRALRAMTTANKDVAWDESIDAIFPCPFERVADWLRSDERELVVAVLEWLNSVRSLFFEPSDASRVCVRRMVDAGVLAAAMRLLSSELQLVRFRAALLVKIFAYYDGGNLAWPSDTVDALAERLCGIALEGQGAFEVDDYEPDDTVCAVAGLARNHGIDVSEQCTAAVCASSAFFSIFADTVFAGAVFSASQVDRMLPVIVAALRGEPTNAAEYRSDDDDDDDDDDDEAVSAGAIMSALKLIKNHLCSDAHVERMLAAVDLSALVALIGHADYGCAAAAVEVLNAVSFTYDDDKPRAKARFAAVMSVGGLRQGVVALMRRGTYSQYVPRADVFFLMHAMWVRQDADVDGSDCLAWLAAGVIGALWHALDQGLDTTIVLRNNWAWQIPLCATTLWRDAAETPSAVALVEHGFIPLVIKSILVASDSETADKLSLLNSVLAAHLPQRRALVQRVQRQYDSASLALLERLHSSTASADEKRAALQRSIFLSRCVSVVSALHQLSVPALQLLEIMDVVAPNCETMHFRWQAICAVKHFHDRRHDGDDA